MNLSLVASALAAAFAAVVAERWLRTRRPAFAAWAAGLAVFSIAAAAQAVGEHSGFGPASFRVFYLFGGLLGVAFLGLGTVYLMAPPAVARGTAVCLVALAVVGAILVAVVPVDEAGLRDPGGTLGAALTGPTRVPIRALAVFLNISGTLALVGGSALSATRLWRRRGGLDRVLCNVLLTAGALVIATGFSVSRVFTSSGLSTLGGYEAVGIGVMFAGFLCIGRVGIRGTAASRPRSGGSAPERKRVP